MYMYNHENLLIMLFGMEPLDGLQHLNELIELYIVYSHLDEMNDVKIVPIILIDG
jgi:hypothetical protein